jgi:V-type H+-transporting ATPase subunit C
MGMRVMQVPRSSKVIVEDNDYALVSVTLFRRVLDDFKAASRTRGYQVREFQTTEESEEQSQESLENLRHAAELKRTALEAWCKTAFGEVQDAIVVCSIVARALMLY